MDPTRTTFVLFLITLTIRCTSGYIKCQEMRDEYHLPEDLKCTLKGIDLSYFYNNYVFNSHGSSIKDFYLRHSTWPFIPEDLFLRFPSLNGLHLSGTGLDLLQNSPFPTQASSLATLDLSRCSFKKLHNQTFSTLHNLEILRLDHGKIEEIDKNAFRGLSKLHELHMVGNRIKVITSKMFSDLENLKHLDLALNRIEVLNARLFEDNLKLHWIRFAANQISLVEDGFVSRQNLTYLSFADNNISRFNSTLIDCEMLFIENNKIEQLHISHQTKIVNASNNFIKSLTCDSSTVLERVHLSNNSVSSMECFIKAVNLTHLDLNNNKIERLNHSSFALLTKLVDLRISHANTGSYFPGILSHQEHLRVLDLSYNKLGSIPMDVYAIGPLHKLLLDGNNLTEIQYERLSSAHPELRWLGIGDNYFTCTHLSEVIAFFKVRGVKVFASSTEKVFHSANLRGIGCDNSESASVPQFNVTNYIQSLQVAVRDLTSQVSVLTNQNARIDEENRELKEKNQNLEQENESDISDLATMSWPLVNHLYNITFEGQPHAFHVQHINETHHEVDVLRRQVKEMKDQQHGSLNNISLTKSLMFACFIVGILWICKIAYKKLKELILMRRHNAQETLSLQHIEMLNDQFIV